MCTKARNRGGKSPDGKESVPSVEKDVYRVSIPPVAADKSARAFEFELVAESKGGEKRTKFVMAEGFNHALAHKRATWKTSCAFALDELPKGEVRFVVTPMNCFHRRGGVQRDFYAAPMRWWSISCCAVDLSEVFDAVLEELFESV